MNIYTAYRQAGDRNLSRNFFRGSGLCFAALALVLAACNSTPKMSIDGVADMDPLPAGSFEAEFPRFFSSAVEKKKINAVFRPRDNMVYLEFKYQTVTYRQYWNQENRARFREALEKYKADYGARNLINRPSRTRRIYGTLKGMAQWGYPVNISILVLNLNSMGYPNYEMGYVFKEDSSRQESPYFTVFQRECQDVYMAGKEVEGKSSNIFVYYTRAQAEDIAGVFDQRYLLSLVQRSPAENSSPEVDAY